MNILALDLASCTGWAYDVKGVRDSGVEDFLRKGETTAWKFMRINAWLCKTWGYWNFDLVVIEQPHHRGGSATYLLNNLAGRVDEYCGRRGWEFRMVHSATIKKFATGNARAEKPQMVQAAQKLKPGVTDDNEADALWLLEYAIAKFGKQL